MKLLAHFNYQCNIRSDSGQKLLWNFSKVQDAIDVVLYSNSHATLILLNSGIHMLTFYLFKNNIETHSNTQFFID
jgi:hypothetical protein